MSQLTLQQAFDLALQHHQAGNLREAESLYQQILYVNPGFVDALHNLGVLAFQLGRIDIATVLFRRTIHLKPSLPEVHSNLGNALMQDGKLDDAIESYRRALALRPGYADALSNLGAALQGKGDYQEAIKVHRQILQLRPDHVESLYNLGMALHHLRRTDEAIAAYRQALELRPKYAEAHNNLGAALIEKGEIDHAVAECRLATELNPDLPLAWHNLGTAVAAKGDLNESVACHSRAIKLLPDWPQGQFAFGNALRAMGKMHEAVAAFQSAVSHQPDYFEAHAALGSALSDQGQLDEAIAALRRATQLRPDIAKIHNNLASAMGLAGQIDEAIAEYRLALKINPTWSEVHANLAGAFKDEGLLDDAIASYRLALAHKPDNIDARSNLIYTMQFHPAYGPKHIAQELAHWNKAYALPLARPDLTYSNSRQPQRRLRIGYISPDFRNHVVGRNVLPLFRNHDHSRFEIFCYAQQFASDEMTQEFQQQADMWRNVIKLTDDELFDQILADQIDILVDLSLHMAGNRLLVFARKPAPVQVTFAGYPGSTGLSAIDYRLSDPYLDPQGMNDSFYSEKTIRLPSSFWCYDPLESRNLPVNNLPAAQNGFVTFACLNNFCKINDTVLALWALVLGEVEGSRLMLIAKQGSHRKRTLDRLARSGIEPGRVEFISHLSRENYMRLYHRADLCLDTFPYNGHTTSLDSLWMGVPVVTLVGQSAVARAGWCQLSNLRLEELAGHTSEQFVQIAVSLANDQNRLSHLRAGLRPLMQQSPLMDAPAFTRSIESAYQFMWSNWCG